MSLFDFPDFYRNEFGLVVPCDYHLYDFGGLHTSFFGCLCQPRIPSRIFPKVTREVRSLLLSDLGNTFPLQTVFVSLFCLFLFFKKKKKHLCKAPWSSNLGIRCLGPAFSVCFCEVTLVSERRLFWVCGSHSSYSIGSSLRGLFS